MVSKVAWCARIQRGAAVMDADIDRACVLRTSSLATTCARGSCAPQGAAPGDEDEPSPGQAGRDCGELHVRSVPEGEPVLGQAIVGTAESSGPWKGVPCTRSRGEPM